MVSVRVGPLSRARRRAPRPGGRRSARRRDRRQARGRADAERHFDSYRRRNCRPAPARRSSRPAAARPRSALSSACASPSRRPAGSPPLRRASSARSLTMSGRLKRAEKREAGKKSACLRPAAIEMPADQILAARGGHVIAGRRPGDPAARRHVDEQGESSAPSDQRSQRIVPSK